MAGSLKRPPFEIIPTYKCSTSKYKSITKYQKLSSLRSQGSQHNLTSSSSQQNPQQLHQLLKQLKYCQSLPLDKLLLLLPSSLSSFSNDSCWTATENKKYHTNLTTTTTAINYVQQQVQQQHQNQQQLHLQLLQILSKVFKSSKFRKNLLNRKKLQLKEILFYRKTQLYEKLF